MAVTELPTEIESVRRVRLDPGDVIVLEVGHHIPNEAMERLADSVKSAFPDNQVLVLCDGIRMIVCGEK